MKQITLFLVLAGAVLGADIPNRYLTANITAQDVADSYRMRIPNWIEDYAKEVASYPLGHDRCQMFAKKAAAHALKAGWECYLVTVVNSRATHMFMCATNGKMFWAVSNKKGGEYDSIEDANLRLCGFGNRIIKKQRVTLSELETLQSDRSIGLNGRTMHLPQVGPGLIMQYPPNLLTFPQKNQRH